MYASKFTSHSFKTDQQQTRRHLEYLGYKFDGNVYLRFFYHSEDLRKNDDKGRKLNRLNWNNIERYQQDGRGVYVVVNGAGGGHEDKDIKSCVAIFCEWDDLPIEEQLLQWEKVGFFKPTFTVYSGDRSVQPYWVFDQTLGDIKQWRELQLLLIEVMSCDPANKNPSRVFRLAGGWHIKPDREPVKTKIVQESGQKYLPQQLLEKLQQIRQQQRPQVEQPTLLQHKTPLLQQTFNGRLSKYKDILVPVPKSVPLEVCLSKDSRQLLQFGVGEGERNSNGAKLARDLVGTANYLKDIGQQFDEEPWQLFLDYCHRCPSGNGWSEGEWKNIWKSAQKDCPTPSCKSDGVDNCIRAWYWNNYIKPSLPERRDRTPSLDLSNPNGNGFSSSPVSTVSLGDRLIEIFNRNLSPCEQKQAFIDLSRSNGYQLREIEQLADLIESDTELAEGRADRVKELELLVKIGDRRLTLSKYLHPNVAQPLEQLAFWMGVDGETLLTVMLPTAASLLDPKTRVIVKECIDFVEPLVFYTGFISGSGNRKSPILKVITKPLRKFQDEEDNRNREAQRQYQEDLKVWKQNKSEDKGESPEPPRLPREYFVDNITGEALDRIKAQQPERGILIRKDELSGLFSSYGTYKGGRGSDKEGILSGWNGDGIKVNRASGSRLSLSHDASSIVGAIQPGKLRKLMGDFEDEQGEWGRFLWYVAPLRPFQLPDEDTRFEVGDLLESVYRKLDRLAPTQYRFTSDAQRLYQNYHSQLEQRRLAEPRQGIRSAIAKMQGYTARIAGILHILWETAAGRTPEQRIPIERMKAANQLTEFYLGQVQLIYSDGEAAQGELNPILTQILMKAKQLGEITARTAKQLIKALNKTPPQKVREYLKELAAMGYGDVEGQGNRIKFIPKTVNQTVDQEKKAETIENTTIISTDTKNCRSTVDPTVDRDKNTESNKETELQPFYDSNCRPVDSVDRFSELASTSGAESQTVDTHVEQGEKDLTVDDGLQSQQVYSSLESTEITSIGAVDQVSTLRSTVDVTAQKLPKIRVGDRCRYNGPPGAMAVTCRGKSLIVLETRLNSDVMEVRVKADEWTVDYWIPYQQLRRETA